jgi:hypothetical protein
MPAISTRKVKTLTEYISLVEEISVEWDRLRTSTHPWFRGQNVARWRLIPGLYRGWIDSYWERELVRDFRLHSHLLLEHTPANYLEWLFLMQHYGMPTRLLDWTESYLSALYFAVASRASIANGAVWVLDSWSLNDHAIGLMSVPTADHEKLKPYAVESGPEGLGRKVAARVPVAVRPPRANPRINAQRGIFTLHGSLKSSLDAIVKDVNKSRSDAPIRLHKIVIDGASKSHLRKELYLAGITEGVLFPDLGGLCGEISYRYSKEYLTDERGAGGAAKLSLRPAPGKGASRSVRGSASDKLVPARKLARVRPTRPRKSGAKKGGGSDNAADGH